MGEPLALFVYVALQNTKSKRPGYSAFALETTGSVRVPSHNRSPHVPDPSCLPRRTALRAGTGRRGEGPHDRRHEGGGAGTGAAVREGDRHKVIIENDTAGGVTRRVEGGEAVDLVVNTPNGLTELATKGKV